MGSGGWFWGNANAIRVPLKLARNSVRCQSSSQTIYLFIYETVEELQSPFIPICSFTSLPRTWPENYARAKKR